MALGLTDSFHLAEKEAIDMSNWVVQKDSIKASDIIKRKLMENNGKAVVYSAQGLPCEIWCNSDSMTAFLSVVINFLTMPYSALKSLM